MVPYIAFSVLGQLVFYVKWLLDGNTPWKDYILSPLRTLLHEGAVVGNSPLWFLLSLFLVKVIFDGVYLWHRKFAVMLTILGGVTAYMLRILEFHNYFYIANVSCGMFFYGCGYLMKNIVYEKSVIFVGALLYAAYAIVYPSYFDFRSNAVAVAVYPFCMIACIAGVVFVDALFKKMKCLQKPFAIVGKNSMTYYASHWVVLGASSLLFQNVLDLKGYVLFVAFALANVIALPFLAIFFNKHVRWMIGK